MISCSQGQNQVWHTASSGLRIPQCISPAPTKSPWAVQYFWVFIIIAAAVFMALAVCAWSVANAVCMGTCRHSVVTPHMARHASMCPCIHLLDLCRYYFSQRANQPAVIQRFLDMQKRLRNAPSTGVVSIVVTDIEGECVQF